MGYDAFMKVDGIEGESTDDKHKKEIEVLSFHWGASQPSSGAASTAGARSAERVNLTDFSIVKQIDKATPKLFLACCKGEHIKSVTVAFYRATGDKQKYLEYKMEDVLVSSVRPGGSTQGDGLPLEEVSFNYGKIEVIYTATDPGTGKPAGDVKANWSQVQNKGG